MAAPIRKGTWLQRFLKNLFTVLFGLLVYWLIGFLINDIGHVDPPDYQAMEQQRIPAELSKEQESLRSRILDLNRQITTQKTRQANLRDSTVNAQMTMNQLLEFQKLSLEKDVKPTPEEQQALAESQKTFLANQQQYQLITEQIASLQSNLDETEAEQRKLDESLEVIKKEVFEEYQQQLERNAMWEASVKLAILSPLLLISLGLFYTRRNSIYVPLFIAFSVAVAIKVLFVMHEYFPARSFKYVLVITFLIVVFRALLSQLRAIAKPGLELLLTQYREAYETFSCPNCNFPIRRGPLKFLYWTRRTIKNLNVQPGLTAPKETAYCCPSCSTQLFEECDVCHEIRHSLLPSCEHCSTTRQITAVAPPQQPAAPEGDR